MTTIHCPGSKRSARSLIGSVMVFVFMSGLGLATPVEAGEQIDQSNIAAPTNNFFAVFSGRQFGQTLTVGTAGFLTRVEMYVDKRGAPAADLVVEVQRVTGGFPNGNVQATASLAPAAVVDGLNSFDVSSAGVAIEVGDQLAIVLRSNSSGGNDYLARAVPGNLYGAGQAVQNAGSGWDTFGTPEQGFDAIFRTWVLPVAQPLPYGSATRVILTGSTFGFPFDPIDRIDGNSDERSTSAWNFVIPAGWAWANGRLIPDGVSAGAYSSTSGPVLRGATAATGGARGIAWRSFVNESETTVTCRLNAQLSGNFGGPAGGTATGFVYAFDASLFDATLDGVSPDAADYLLADDGLNDLATGGNILSLTGLFPSEAVLASGFELLDFGLGDQSVPVQSSFMTLAPDQVFTVMFDISVHSPGPGSANFAETLTPAPVFFTDESDMPVTGITATGPAIDPEVPPGSIVLSPESASAPVGTMQTATATVTDGAATPVGGALVFFTITSGPNTGLSGPVTTDETGLAEFGYTDMSGTGGTDSIEAATGALQSNVVSLTWTVPGPLDHITIAPLAVTVPPGQSVAFTTEAFDLFGNSRGDVTGETNFSITDGNCVGASCSATTPGDHTVTANHNGVLATATLTVEADTDGDGVVDSADNCTLVGNPAQTDTDGDGIGNFCDPDVAVPNDCVVNFLDLNVYKASFFQPGGGDTDNNGDGLTNFADLNILKNFFFGPPGPSATGCN